MSIMNDFAVEVLAFITDLHNCHICKYAQSQIHNRNGKRRTFCSKYRMPIQRVRYHCIDCFNMGFTSQEIREIKRQHKEGKCELVIKPYA